MSSEGSGRERRQADRVAVNCRVEVIEKESRDMLGVLMDISATGLMISSDQPIEVGTLHQLCLVLCDDDLFSGNCPIDIGVEIVWLQQAPDTSHAWIGLHIIDMDEENSMRIGQLIASWQEEDLEDLEDLI